MLKKLIVVVLISIISSAYAKDFEVVERKQGLGVDLGYTSREFSDLELPNVYMPEFGIKYLIAKEKVTHEIRACYGFSDQTEFKDDQVFIMSDGFTAVMFNKVKHSYWGLEYNFLLGNKLQEDTFYFGAGFNMGTLLSENSDYGFKTNLFYLQTGYSFMLSDSFFIEPNIRAYKATVGTIIYDGTDNDLGSDSYENTGMSFGISLSFYPEF